MTNEETLRDALTALLHECKEAGFGSAKDYRWPKVIPAAEAALAATAAPASQEPVACMWTEHSGIAGSPLVRYADVAPGYITDAVMLYPPPPPAAPAHTDHPMRHWYRTCPACNIAQPAEPSAALHQLRDRIKEMQEAAYTCGESCKEAVTIALDGVLEEIDAAIAQKP